MSIEKGWRLVTAASSATTGTPDSSGSPGAVRGLPDESGVPVIVRGIVPDSPAAAQTETDLGDRIIAVAEDKAPAVQVQSGQLAQAVAQIQGPKGTKVSLTIVPSEEGDSRVWLRRNRKVWQVMTHEYFHETQTAARRH